MTLCEIWYYLQNLKNVINFQKGVLLLLRVTLLHGCFSRFLNSKFAQRIKLRKASHMIGKMFLHGLRNIVNTEKRAERP